MRVSAPFAAAAMLIAAHAVLTARVDVKVEYDKKFDFKSVRTWGWNPKGPGELRMARTEYDDPDTMKKAAEPVIIDAVTTEMKQRGLAAAPDKPDLFVTYYLLLTTGFSAQTMGQFLPSVTQWAVPPFPQATQSLEVMNQGSLVLDLSAGETIVWRGVAQSKIQIGADRKKREALLREGVRDLLKKYPRK